MRPPVSAGFDESIFARKIVQNRSLKFNVWHFRRIAFQSAVAIFKSARIPASMAHLMPRVLGGSNANRNVRIGCHLFLISRFSLHYRSMCSVREIRPVRWFWRIAHPNLRGPKIKCAFQNLQFFKIKKRLTFQSCPVTRAMQYVSLQ